jgi:hypothetical protein
MATGSASGAAPPLETLASPSAVRQPRSTRVDWVELRAIADKVQQALDAARELDDHPDYEYVSLPTCPSDWQ